MTGASRKDTKVRQHVISIIIARPLSEFRLFEPTFVAGDATPDYWVLQVSGRGA